ncbi:MAG: hypothetical protein KA217_05995 [Gammaproteobacteria bacterium]|nr:hypothetical protein [Gammaproteobacteria bacterium]
MKKRTLVTIAACLCAASTQASVAAVLDFNNLGLAGGGLIPQTYGDEAGILDVSYRSLAGVGNAPEQSESLRFWSSNLTYSGLVNVAYAGAVNAVGEITFTPAPGYMLTLDSLELGSYAGTARNSVVTVFTGDYTQVLFSTNTLSIGPTAVTVTPGVSSVGPIHLQFGPEAYNVAIDNVRYFAEVAPPVHTPIPAPALLLASSLLGIAGLARRKTRAE